MNERDAVAESLPAEGAAPWRQRNMAAPDRWFGYNGLSLALHWLTALAVIVLAVLPNPMHAAIGIWLALPLAWRAVRRFVRGFPRVADQPALFNLAFRLAMIALAAAIVVLAVSGALLWFIGLDVPLLPVIATVQQWLAASAPVTGALRALHVWSWYVGLAAFAVHMLAAVKHGVTRADGILLRIVRPVKDAR